MPQVVSFSLYRFGSFRSRVWAFAMMGLARGGMARTPKIGFWKLCGSGTGEGFTPFPNASVYAIIATWPDAQTARDSIRDGAVFQKYRNQSSEDWTLFMTADTVRGAWSGQEPFVAENPANSGPLAVLTRATIKPSILARFWKRVPNISKVIGQDPNVIFKIGVGEVPWLHQVTFSVWPNAKDMINFARNGPHADAITAVRDEGWFNEELYARFSLLSDVGTWGGTSPLKQLDTA